MCVFVWFFIPETKGESEHLQILFSHIALANPVNPGMSLEKMDDLFGVTELLQQKDDLEHSSTPAQVNKATESHVERVV